MELKEPAPVMRAFTTFIIALLFLAACGDSHDYSPKPRGYFRIDLPEKSYQPYVSNYPFTFDYPTYAKMELDSNPSRNRLQKMQYLLL